MLFLFVGVNIPSLNAQELLVIKSKYLKANDSILVFKPSKYDVEKQYPLVYLLHGHSANFKSWSKLTNLQSIANEHQMIIVCPDGLKKSWYINSPLSDSSQFENFFINELKPFIHEKYNVNQSQIFISGASMGGFGSLWLFMQHSDYFKSAGSTSGVVNLAHSAFKNTTLASHLGKYSTDNKNFEKFSIVNNVKRLANINKPIIFDAGTEDYLYKSNKALRDSCDVYKVKATYLAQPGSHIGAYWSKTILTHFNFFSELVKKDSEE